MNIKDLLKDAYKEGMSVEDIEKALEGIEMPTDNSAEIDRLKTALTKSNSEAADYKKQLREKMTAEEVKAKEDAEKYDAILKERDALLRDKTIAIYKAKYLALGYDEKIAIETAEALANGDIDKVFNNHKKNNEVIEKKVREDVLKETPRAEGGGGKPASVEDILKIADSDARQTAIAENIELFK